MRGGRTASFLCEVASVLLLSWGAAGRAAEEGSLAAKAPAPGEKETARQEIMLYSKPRAGIYLRKGSATDKRISYVQAPYAAPRLSPDQKTILFHSKRGGKIGIWLMDDKGERVERVCDGEQAEWSSRDRKIIFAREGRILERRLDNGEERTLTPADWADCCFPSYLPDGGVVFVVRKGSKGKLFLAGSNGGDAPKQLLEAEMSSAPRCSPDGNFLAYQDGAHIYLMDLRDGARSQFTTAGGLQSWPIWSLDGKSMAYCQAPAPYGPWDLDCVKINAPGSATVLRRGVDPAPDWSATGEVRRDLKNVKGTPISVRVAEGREGPEDPTAPNPNGTGWKPLPPASRRLTITTPLLVENDWYSVAIIPAKGVVVLSSRTGGGRIVIAASAEDATPAEEGAPPTAVLTSHPDEFVAEVSLGRASGKPARAMLRIPRCSPYIRIEPTEGLDELFIKEEMRFVLIPDRFSNDLLVSAEKCSSPEAALPFSPFVLAGAADGKSLCLLATPSAGQSSSAIVNHGLFSKIRVAPAGKPVLICALPALDLLYELHAPADADVADKGLAWSVPLAGRWRAGLFGARNYAEMIDDKTVFSGKSPHVVINRSQGRVFIHNFPRPLDTALVYLYGRDSETPLDAFTPEDILWDALGIEASERLLDSNGIANYRTAENPLPLRELLTPVRGSGGNWLPFQVNHKAGDKLSWRRFIRPEMDFSAILELMGGGDYGGLRMTDSEGIRSALTHYLGDISGLLKGLDDRIGEYDRFLSDLDGLCQRAQGQSNPPNDFFAMTREQIRALRTKCGSASVTKLDVVNKCIADILALPGSGGMLGKKKEFDRLCEVSQSALGERQAVLTDYREFAKTVRDNAGMLITRQKEAKDAGERIRALTQGALRNRCYLEGDWRGEEARNGGAL